MDKIVRYCCICGRDIAEVGGQKIRRRMKYCVDHKPVHKTAYYKRQEVEKYVKASNKYGWN